MAVPTAWFVRSSASDLNSAGSDADAAVMGTANGVVVGTNLSDVGGGFNALGSNGLGINLQVGGNSEIRGYTVVDDNNITLDAAPSAGNGTYAYKIGGARKTIKKVVQTGTDQNAKFAANNSVGIKGGTYTENVVTPAAACRMFSSDGVEWVIDGTGGAAGSDCLVISGQAVTVRDGAAINAVDDGFVLGSAAASTLFKCRAQACGGNGVELGSGARRVSFCKVIASVGAQINESSGAAIIEGCGVDGGTTHGLVSTTGALTVNDNVFSDNGGDGWNQNGTVTTALFVYSNTFEGNTGSGIEFVTALGVATSSRFLNNLVTNNGDYGIKSTAGAQTNPYATDYNDYFGNTTGARLNFDAGTNDIATDPQYVAAASDDYTPQALAVSRGGYSALGTSNKVPIGAVVGPAGGGYPSEDDVRDGTVFGSASEFTGNLVLPVDDDVEFGVGYGTSGTEFTGTVTLPTEASVRDGAQYGADGTEFTGTLELPIENDVRDGVQYGSGGTEFEGNVVLPGVGDVKDGVQYGASGTEFTGTLAATGGVVTTGVFPPQRGRASTR
jgi:hypothetical protein